MNSDYSIKQFQTVQKSLIINQINHLERIPEASGLGILVNVIPAFLPKSR